MFNLVVSNEQALIQLARLTAKYLTSNMTLLLDGELGAGKTTFTKGLAIGLNITSLIKSPTYTFVKEYTTGRLPLYHMDVYRLENVGGEGLGFEEYFERDGVCVVEWSQFIEEQLPVHFLIIHIERVIDDENARLITFKAQGEKYSDLVKNIEKQNYSC